MYTEEKMELPKNLINRLADMSIKTTNENGFIWIRRCVSNFIEVLVEDGNGNTDTLKYKVKNEYDIEESYMYRRSNVRIYVGNDSGNKSEVGTIWNNNKRRLNNPLDNLRTRYIPSGSYTGDKNWLKRLDKIEEKSKILKEKSFISNYKRSEAEVIIKCNNLIYIFGVNYAVATSLDGKIATELFEIASHKDSISSAKDKCANKLMTPNQIVALIQEYDLR